MTRCICPKTVHDEACPVCIPGDPDIAINVKAYTAPTQKEIQIGCETWAYKIEGSYTHVTDTDGEPAFTLRWAATEKEITAAAYGHAAGLRAGKKLGRAQKQAEILGSLGLSNATGERTETRPEDA